jgi:hypothetical protein
MLWSAGSAEGNHPLKGYTVVRLIALSWSSRHDPSNMQWYTNAEAPSKDLWEWKCEN